MYNMYSSMIVYHFRRLSQCTRTCVHLQEPIPYDDIDDEPGYYDDEDEEDYGDGEEIDDMDDDYERVSGNMVLLRNM